MWRAQNFRCGICRGPILPSEVLQPDVINIDHIRPRSHGGSDDPGNLQLSHEPCNSAKGSQCAGCEFCR